MKANTYKNWSTEEIELLKKYVEEGIPRQQIAKLLNRTFHSIGLRMKKLKLKYSKEHTYKFKSDAVSGKNNPMYGKQSWMKGKTKENNDIVKKGAEKLSIKRKDMFKKGLLPDISGENNPMYGKESWNYGKTKYDNEIIKNSSFKQSETMKTNWKNLSNEQKEIRIEKLLIILSKCRLKQKNTDIEIIIKKILENMGLILNKDFFMNHRYQKFIFDIFIPSSNLVIECQGDYWHANPKFFDITKLNKIQLSNVERDIRKEKFLKENNFNYMFFWEDDIKHNHEQIINKINSMLSILTETP
jgi:G:T-mismatch repair DNA endonuclease (very short patch repair protein)